MDYFHIYPADEEKRHKLGEETECPCDPHVKYNEKEDVIFVIHNSFDGREAVEEANRILNQ